MDGIVAELVILMKKSTDLLENMSLQKDPTSSLANKNISNAGESSTFGKKESSDLNQNETKKRKRRYQPNQIKHRLPLNPSTPKYHRRWRLGAYA